MVAHNATGRNHHPSKAERQQALVKPIETKPTETKTEAKPTAEVKPIDPNRGAATRARWSACLKSRPGAKLVMAADVKALSHDSVITALVPGNPKKRSAADRYEFYKFNGKEGASVTIGELLKFLGERHSHTLAFADIAWDINHGFIKVETPVTQPVDETKPEDVAAHAAEPTGEPTEESQAA